MSILLLLLLCLPAPHADTCDSYGASTEVASIEGSAINESSGLVYARTRPGVWFTHNDAGGSAEIYAFDLNDNFLETHAVQGASFRDWEDMAAGPCPPPNTDAACLYIGDIGDNGHVRTYVTVYAVAEPAAGVDAQVLATWFVAYPDEVQDSETLFVHPLTGRVYLVSKSYDGVSEVYLLPELPSDNAAEPGLLEHVATLPLSTWGATNLATTGGDWEADGDRLVIRTYSHLFEWVTDPCEPSAHWGNAPLVLSASDTQGEAVSYTPEGDLLTSSEGATMVLKRFACNALRSGAGPCGEPDDTGDPVELDTGSPEDTGGDEPNDTGNLDTADTGGGGDTGTDTGAHWLAGGFYGGCEAGVGRAALFLPLGLLGWLLPAQRRRRPRQVEARS